MNPGTTTPTVRRSEPMGTRSNLAIRAKDIMTTRIVSVGPGASVRAIAELLSERHVSAVLVAERGELLGIVSEGDLLNRQELGTEIERFLSFGSRDDPAIVAALEAKSHGMHARDVMTRNIVSVGEETVLADVVKMLQAQHIRQVPVTRGMIPVGIVSRADIMRALASRPEGSHGPSSRDDDMIRYQIIEILLSIPGTSPWATTVTVSKGVVELGGSVENEVTRDPSRIAIENLPGVVEVKDWRAIQHPY